MSAVGTRYAALGMYPFPALRHAWDALYASVADIARSHGVDAPAELRWDVDPHDTWLDPDLAVGMTCGWPLVTALREQVRMVGTFSYDLPVAGPAPHVYRTVIIARNDVPLADLASARTAVNSPDSLSGHISLLAAFGHGAVWPGEVLYTGAHVDSIQAVRNGLADVASIDGMTWAFQQRTAPETLTGLVEVGNGPFVPCLPVIVGAHATDAERDGWRHAFVEAVRERHAADALDVLMIRDFVALDDGDYDAELAWLLERHAPVKG
ncbi:MAG: phosphate transporter substrate-binding protein [Ilumatobacteraceae bacterium]|nr:phosphate transporter substrate-binding protein [Ilumatobacteraceae bacterium]